MSALISDSYRSQQEELHEAGNYGTASILYAPIVSGVVNRMSVGHLLDYGCGSNVNLAKHIGCRGCEYHPAPGFPLAHKLTYQAYDPGVPRFSKPPLPAEMVACIDVLEHIEPHLLDNVLDDLARLCEGIIFLTVTTCAALKTLSDGRNAHLIQQPMSWWMPKFFKRWELQTMQGISDNSFFVVGTAKPHIEGLNGEPLFEETNPRLVVAGE